MSHRSSNVSKHRKPSTKLLFLNSRFLNNTQESLHAPFLQFLSHDLKAKIKELASSSFANTFGLTLDFFWVLLWFFFFILSHFSKYIIWRSVIEILQIFCNILYRKKVCCSKKNCVAVEQLPQIKGYILIQTLTSGLWI